MSKISNSKVKPILRSMYPSRRFKVPLFIGAPGIGKTRGIFEFAEEQGVKVVQFILSNTIPSEVSGIRMPDRDTKKLEVFDDARMSSLEDGDILFFDEILEAPPMLWSACLTLIQDRVMASGRLLPDVMIVAASNPVVSPGFIPPSVRDRFDAIELKFDFNDWSQWFEDKFGVSPEKIRGKLQEDSDQYNILSPRKFVSEYLWAKDVVKHGGDMGMIEDVLTSMFDMHTAHIIMDLADARSAEQQIIDALKGAWIFDQSLIDSLYGKNIDELLAILQNSPDWPQIQRILASTLIVE